MHPAPRAPASFDGEIDGDAHLQRIRRRVVLTLALMFVVIMALSAMLTGEEPPETVTMMVRLAVLAVALPVVMALVARRIIEPIEGMVATGDQLRDLYNRARHDALSDPLTGLGNHRAFQEEMVRQIEASRRHGYPVSLVLIDLDDLKRTNDERGHSAGDGLLASMGRLVATTIRASDRGFRIGGDEFAILLPHADAEAAHLTVRRLLAMALGDEAGTRGGVTFSFSAGISTFPELTADAHRFRRQADAALYWAKRHGRTDVQVFDAERHGVTDEERATPELAAAVADVAKRRALEPRYQPIYDLRTGRPIGFEGLVRPDATAGFPDSLSLFVAAEASERSVELDFACIDVLLAGAHLAEAEQYLSLNLSPRSLETDQFRVSDLLGRLAPYGISPQQVVIELTEREAIEDLARLSSNLEACRAAGIRIAADDVGAGNAGLRLLSEIEFDVVKVDLSLVQGGVLRDAALGVVSAIRDLADRSHAAVVAEGIETAEQLAAVRRLGIRAGQGYLLAKPSSAAEAEPIDLDALEIVDAPNPWLPPDPRLVKLGLQAAPLEERHAEDEQTPPQIEGVQPKPSKRPAAAKRAPARKKRVASNGQSAAGAPKAKGAEPGSTTRAAGSRA